MGRFVFRLLISTWCIGLCAAAPPAAAVKPRTGELAAARAVIEAQLQAIARNDGAAAFSYASPAIQKRFGTASAFLQMVRRQYAPVYRPTSVVFLAPQTGGDSIVYPVQLADRDGRVWIAMYTMLRLGREWRVSGCGLFAGNAIST